MNCISFEQLLEVVWGLCHVDTLPTYLINQAVQSHLDILTESQCLKDQIKYAYISKCMQDIKDGIWIVPAIRHLLNNLEALLKQPYSKSHKVRVCFCVLCVLCVLFMRFMCSMSLCVLCVYVLLAERTRRCPEKLRKILS